MLILNTNQPPLLAFLRSLLYISRYRALLREAEVMVSQMLKINKLKAREVKLQKRMIPQKVKEEKIISSHV